MNQKRLSFDSQSSDDLASSHAHDSIHGLLTPPTSRKSTPASSVEASSQHGDSKPSSRTSSAEFASPAVDQSSSQADEKISYAIAEIVSFDALDVSLPFAYETSQGRNSATSRYHRASCLRAGLMTRYIFKWFATNSTAAITVYRAPCWQRWRQIQISEPLDI